MRTEGLRTTDAAPAGADRPAARRSASPVLGLQRKIGNRATGEVLARKPATKDYGTVRIGKLPPIKIVGGNAGAWATDEPTALEISSLKGRHSAELDRLSKAGNRIPMLKVTMPIDQGGHHLDFGSIEVEFSHARIAGYELDGKLESWSAVDFDRIHRTTISHKTGI
jgi:hypothetical protein